MIGGHQGASRRHRSSRSPPISFRNFAYPLKLSFAPLATSGAPMATARRRGKFCAAFRRLKSA
eukprot:12002584-Prorocentrum_lima.AAC.1